MGPQNETAFISRCHSRRNYASCVRGNATSRHSASAQHGDGVCRHGISCCFTLAWSVECSESQAEPSQFRPAPGRRYLDRNSRPGTHRNWPDRAFARPDVDVLLQAPSSACAAEHAVWVRKLCGAWSSAAVPDAAGNLERCLAPRPGNPAMESAAAVDVCCLRTNGRSRNCISVGREAAPALGADLRRAFCQCRCNSDFRIHPEDTE